MSIPDRAGGPPAAPLRVLLVDDQALLRSGLRMVLEEQPDLVIVGEAADGRAALDETARLRPDVVLMDVRMPVMDGIEATRRIVEDHSASKVLILTTFDLDEYAFTALRYGASGFLLKDVPPAELAGAIRAVASGDAVVAPSVTRRLLDAFADRLPDLRSAPPGRAADALSALTDREREILVEVASGLSNQEIAARLFVAEATVKTHLGRILAKLGLRDRVQAVVFAYQIGLVRPEGR
ncbi:response regulator [Acidiferrimicrobium sp. IK]|uniref:response regulator n=1 Tax=Acidiferrimicrobium sp. IK TaxID=2871700 RepID=UPI0021CB67EE|nr:response regulator transcription factor [Acidiferrimicrobium sp. IK]